MESSNEVQTGSSILPKGDGIVRIGRRRRIAAAIVASSLACVGSAFASSAGGGIRTEDAELPAHPVNARVVVFGCPSEDSCRADFRRNRHGEFVWVIRRYVP